MKTKHIEEYHNKGGCHFYGNLVVVNYLESAKQDHRWGEFDAEITLDYLAAARKLVSEKYGRTEELLAIPELVVRIQ